jgi:hypothetical protein
MDTAEEAIETIGEISRKNSPATTFFVEAETICVTSSSLAL